MNTITIHTYSFSELKKEVQKKVIKEQWDINISHDLWYDPVFEDSKEIGKILGLEIKELGFSLDNSWGDNGAWFDGKYSYSKDSVEKIKEYAPLDIELHGFASKLAEIQEKYSGEIRAYITVRRHVEIEVEYLSGDEEVPDEVETAVKAILQEFMDWIYEQLHKLQESLLTTEEIIYTLESNDYQFTENGNRIIYL